LAISWFEQKAVAIFLTLLALDVKGVRLGPNPPAFVSSNVFRILQDKYNLRLTNGHAAADVQAALAHK
jgi:hydroxylamine reductase